MGLLLGLNTFVLSIIAGFSIESTDLLALNKCLLFFNCTVQGRLCPVWTPYFEVLEPRSSVIVLPSITNAIRLKVEFVNC